jgi:hypothetical protein
MTSWPWQRTAKPYGVHEGTHRLIASQDQLQADMEATIDIPKDMADKARKRAKQMTKARRDSLCPLAD